MKKVKDFPGLIRWIAQTHHHGKLHPVAERAGIGWTTVHQWSRGIIRNPGIVTVWKLCAAYDLDLVEVLHLFRPPPRRRTPIGTGSTVPSPPAPRGAAAGVEVLCQALRLWFPLRWGWLDGSLTWSPA